MPLLVLGGALHHRGQGRCSVETRDRRRQPGEPVGRLVLDPGAEGPRFRRDAALSLRHQPWTPPPAPASAFASEPCGAPVPPSIADRASSFFSVACWACAVEQPAFAPTAAPPSTSIRKSLRKSIVPPLEGRRRIRQGRSAAYHWFATPEDGRESDCALRHPPEHVQHPTTVRGY